MFCQLQNGITIIISSDTTIKRKFECKYICSCVTRSFTHICTPPCKDPNKNGSSHSGNGNNAAREFSLKQISFKGWVGSVGMYRITPT